MIQQENRNQDFEEKVPVAGDRQIEANKVDNLSRCVENTKIVLVSFYEDILKRVKEIFMGVKSFCKKTYGFIFEKLYTQEESIEV
jgi:hypothetical protein